MDGARGRVVALIALLVLVGVALRGYLPGGEKHAGEQPSSNPAATIAVITLLGAAIAIITIAIIATLRQPRTPRQDGRPLPDSPSGERTRASWRGLLIAVGLILAWLVFVVLLLRLSVVLDLGHPSATTAAAPPAPASTPAPRPAPPAPHPEHANILRYLLATTIFMMVVWLTGFVLALRRRRREPLAQAAFGDDKAVSGDQPPVSRSLAVAAERGLAEMGDLNRDPREAIIACYAAMEDALANAPGAMPLDSDTPSEVLARAVEHHAIHAGTATGLVELFAEARFSPHVMTEQHREVAVHALQMVLAELKSAA
ncbi:MAG: DUF4129 domain-containing protein [Mycobacteriaceae bacterium]|nr:DUF4129 domain-containing protein [Mycobacteriaceae bacterium]